MNKNQRFFLLPLSAAVFLAGVCTATAWGQGGRGGNGGNTGSGGFNTGSGGFNTGGPGGTGGGGNSGGSSSSSLFNNSSGSSSLFNSNSNNSGGGNNGSNSGGNSTGSGSNSGTTIETAALGQSNMPLTRGEVLNRNGVGSNLINSSPDLIGGQPTSGNQFANLFSQIGRQINQGGNFNQQGGRNAARPPIRIPLRLGFVPKPLSVPQFTARFESRIAKLSGITSVGPIRVTMEGSTAVLQGVVAAEQDRQLAEGVAMLEPEVDFVRNELTVQGEEAGSAELSPSTGTP